jgi:hypothetical protein
MSTPNVASASDATLFQTPHHCQILQARKVTMSTPHVALYQMTPWTQSPTQKHLNLPSSNLMASCRVRWYHQTTGTADDVAELLSRRVQPSYGLGLLSVEPLLRNGTFETQPQATLHGNDHHSLMCHVGTISDNARILGPIQISRPLTYQLSLKNKK